ncbi:MAG: ATP-dependent zinc protease [Pseudomonadota bacterium]
MYLKYLVLFAFSLIILSMNACAPKQKPSPHNPQTVVPEIKQDVQEHSSQEHEAQTKPEPTPKPKPKPKPKAESPPKAPEKDIPKPSQVHEITIIGETEYIYIDALNMRLPARIDTGAATSSLSATNIQRFERDGKKWVRFSIVLPDGTPSQSIERPWRRTVSVKRHGMENHRRYVVELKIRMGKLQERTEFTLTDRSNFDYPALIGRTFLRGNIAVDVSRKNLTSPMSQ